MKYLFTSYDLSSEGDTYIIVNAESEEEAQKKVLIELINDGVITWDNLDDTFDLNLIPESEIKTI